MNRKKTLRIFIYLSFGILLLFYVYRDLELKKINYAFLHLKWGWVVLSLLLALLSNLMATFRWRMLIIPLSYRPRIWNVFLSFMVLYFTNLIIPRGGEIARCGILSKYERIPFAKLIGTVVTERITDMLVFVVIFIGVLVLELPLISEIAGATSEYLNAQHLAGWLFVLIPIMVLILAFIIAPKKIPFIFKVKNKVRDLSKEVWIGISGIWHMKYKWIYILLSTLIFLFWLLMVYVLFFAYEPTQGLNFRISVITFTVATLAYILPIQAGMGAWHFLVIQCLLLFGIDKDSGMVFALIAHTFTNLIYLIFGAIAFVILPFVNTVEASEIKVPETEIADSRISV